MHRVVDPCCGHSGATGNIEVTRSPGFGRVVSGPVANSADTYNDDRSNYNKCCFGEGPGTEVHWLSTASTVSAPAQGERATALSVASILFAVRLA
jgi:hypothetical protein